MITAEQLRQIASLPDDADFRFETDGRGQTVVVVRESEKTPLLIYENGTRLIAGPKSWCAFMPLTFLAFSAV